MRFAGWRTAASAGSCSRRRQSFLVDGRRRFWGNLTAGSSAAGSGSSRRRRSRPNGAGVMLRFETRLVELELSEGRVVGVVVAGPDGRERIEAGAVVLASGGFEADASRRAAYLGPGWDLAKVRGTPYDTGDPMFLAIAAGAATAGHWSGCHAIAWDAAAPPFGDRVLTNRFSRQSYPFGLVVDRDGRRFVDEGADFRNYTYARYGAEILRRPGALAFHLFDATTAPFIGHVDYSTAIEVGRRFEAASLEELADCAGIDSAGLRRTITEFNAGGRGRPFDPTIKDGKGTVGVIPPKSNWAQRFDTPPFVAYAVTCGITFTFGGLRIDRHGRVLDATGRRSPGSYAAGEIVGGLFHNNYPGGSGLTSGTVFGRRAGSTAADAGKRASDGRTAGDGGAVVPPRVRHPAPDNGHGRLPVLSGRAAWGDARDRATRPRRLHGRGGRARIADVPRAHRPARPQGRRRDRSFGGPDRRRSGANRMPELLDDVSQRTGRPASTDLENHITALRSLGVERVALGSRWPEAVVDGVIRYLAAAGIEVVAVRARSHALATLKASDPAADHELALDLGREVLGASPDAQALMLPGGLWFALYAAPDLEQEFGVPVTLNITATLFAALRRRPWPLPFRPDPAWGRLLASL